MSESLTNRIVDSIATRLAVEAADGGVAVNVARSRRRPAELAELPLISVRPLTERVSKATPNRNCPAVMRALDVAVVVRCAGEDADLDPFRTFVIEAVMSDMTCGGLANEIQEIQHDWDGDGAASEADYAEDSIVFTVHYQTARATAVSK